MFIQKPHKLHVSGAALRAYEAMLGGAVYILAVDEAETTFSSCVFEGNSAADGGAVYLYTGNAVGSFVASVFSGNVARKSRIHLCVCKGSCLQ